MSVTTETKYRASCSNKCNWFWPFNKIMKIGEPESKKCVVSNELKPRWPPSHIICLWLSLGRDIRTCIQHLCDCSKLIFASYHESSDVWHKPMFSPLSVTTLWANSTKALPPKWPPSAKILRLSPFIHINHLLILAYVNFFVLGFLNYLFCMCTSRLRPITFQ